MMGGENVNDDCLRSGTKKLKVSVLTDRQRDTQTFRQAGRQVDIQTYRQTDTQAFRQAGRQVDIQTY